MVPIVENRFDTAAGEFLFHVTVNPLGQITESHVQSDFVVADKRMQFASEAGHSENLDVLTARKTQCFLNQR